MKKTLFLILLLFLLSCQNSSKNKHNEISIIDLTEVEYSESPQLLSDFVESIEYIKLSEDPLVTDARKINLFEDKKGNFYLDVPGGLFKYASDGSFIKNLIRIGQGPNEINHKANAIFNLEQEFIQIDDNGKSYYQKISLDGDFLDRTSSSIIVDGKYLGKRNIYDYWKNFELYKWSSRYGLPNQGEYINRDSLYFFHIKDLNTDSDIYKMKNHHFHIKGKIDGNWYQNYSYPTYRGELNDSTYWVKPLFVDTVYCTSDWTDVRPLYVIKKSSSASDYEWEIKLFAGDRNVSRIELMNKDRLIDVLALENGILYTYFEESGKLGAGFCPANRKATTFSKFFKNDVDEFCPSLNMERRIANRNFFQKEGYIYTLVNAFEFFEEGAKPPFTDMTEDSNPIIVKLKLK